MADPRFLAAAAQLTSTEDVSKNLTTCRGLAAKAAGLEDEILEPDGSAATASEQAPKATRIISISDLPRVS